MKKVKVPMTFTKNFSNVYYCKYGDLQYIFSDVEPQFYNSGVYGWNCDLYVDYEHDLIITTGYRNLRGKPIPEKLLYGCSKYAEVIRKYPIDSLTIKSHLNENREYFLSKLAEL